MPELHTQDVKFVDCNEWDRFVVECLDRPYNSLHTRSHGYSQDEVVDINTAEWYAMEGKAVNAVELWLAAPVPDDNANWCIVDEYENKIPGIELVAEYLHIKRLLPDGKYVIRMWW